MDMWKELRDEGVDAALLDEVRRFREQHPLTPEAQARVPVPRYLYYGKEVWESAAAALLCGQHLLLAGPKATGKNVLAEDLAALFGRPVWDVSMYVNVDAAALIGADTLKDGQVVFREGPVCACARLGGFGVLDEVNMAKNEALAVLHATLDHRRVIDVPGYERITLDDAARFIGTMNYGYAGTRELNEALVSRFVVVDMPVISDENLQKLLRRSFPTLKREWAEQLTALFREGAGPAGTAGGTAPDREGDTLRAGAGPGHHQQGLRALRAAAGGGRGVGAAAQGRHPGQAVRLIWTDRTSRRAGRKTRCGTAGATIRGGRSC